MTDEWRLEPLVVRVVAWHDRHPLARRITPQLVQSFGFVALPFLAPTAAFTEDFIAPLSPARVARWATLHAETSERVQAVDELLREPGSQKLQVDLLPEGDDWRIVGSPFTRRADAERARALLLARRLKVGVLDF